MLENVLKAPMSFFDTNPKGRIVNRFAKDVDLVDRAIPMTLEALLRLLFQVGSAYRTPKRAIRCLGLVYFNECVLEKPYPDLYYPFTSVAMNVYSPKNV